MRRTKVHLLNLMEKIAGKDKSLSIVALQKTQGVDKEDHGNKKTRTHKIFLIAIDFIIINKSIQILDEAGIKLNLRPMELKNKNAAKQSWKTR